MVDAGLLIAGIAVIAFDAYAYYEYKHSREQLESTLQEQPKEQAAFGSPRAASLYGQLAPSRVLASVASAGERSALVQSPHPVHPDVQAALQDLSSELGSLRTQVQVLGTPSEYVEVKALQHSLEDLKSNRERALDDIELIKHALQDMREELDSIKSKPRRTLTSRELEEREKQLQKLYMQRKIDEDTFKRLAAELTRAKLDF